MNFEVAIPTEQVIRSCSLTRFLIKAAISLPSPKSRFEPLTSRKASSIDSGSTGGVKSKKISKTQSVTSQLDYDMGPGNVHIGPSDYVQWLDDRKWAFVRLEGRAFGDVPLNIEYKLEVWDSPNSAGVIIDAVRCAKLALDRKIGGPLLSPSSYFMKSPPEQYSDEEALNRTTDFIEGKLER